MRLDPQQLARMMTKRPIPVQLDQATEHRVRLHIDRVNRELERDGDRQINPDDDAELAEVLECLVWSGLDRSEAAAGLASTWTGEVMSREVRQEHLRRMRAGGEA